MKNELNIHITGKISPELLTMDVVVVSIQRPETKLSEGFRNIRQKFGKSFDAVEPADFLEMLRGD